MLAPVLVPVLLGFLLTWRTPSPARSHPQHGPCHLVQRTAQCQNGTLTSVPAWLPGNIEELHLDYNRIATLQDSSFSYPRLASLTLACNGLERLQPNTFQDSKLLRSLNLAHNDLHVGYEESGDALKTLPGLRALDLSENLLSEDMAAALLQNLTSLEYLNLSGNLLQRLDESSFRDLRRLRELDLQRNLMFEIDGAFDSTPKLQRLNLAFNALPCLYDFHMTQMVVLNASHNALEWFISRQELNDTFQLETLDLSHNRLLFFPFLPTRSRLQNLLLSHNTIRFYEHVAANANATATANLSATVDFYNLSNDTANVTVRLWAEDLHGDLSSVEVLDLAVNQLDYFPGGFLRDMAALRRLHVRSNCLATLNLTSERISGSLYELDVSDNRLTQLAADEGAAVALGNLTYVNVSLNRLERLPPALFSWLPSVRSVDLSANHVHICLPEDANATGACADWSAAAPLRQLYLRGCGLKTVPPSAFGGAALTHLELSDNPGLAVQGSLRSLPGTLQHLGLGNTRLQDPDLSALRGLTSLDISRNDLRRLPPSVLDLDLRVLDLRDNRLSALPLEQADALGGRLDTIFLTGNPLNCCQIEWLGRFRGGAVVGRAQLECEDLFLRTHSVDHASAFMCLKEGRESVVWYLVLFVPICLSFVGMLVIVLQTFRPRPPQKLTKKSFKPSPY